MSVKTLEILEQLKSLAPSETNQLVKQIEATFNVDASTSALIQFEKRDEQDEVEPVQTQFDVVLQSVSADKKITLLKVVRTLTKFKSWGIKPTRDSIVTDIEMFQKSLKEGVAGLNVGVLLRGIQKEDIERGMVLAAPGSITPHTRFESEVYVLKKQEGGRHKPFFPGYKPQFFVRTTDVTGTISTITTDDGHVMEMVMPGDRVKMAVELKDAIAIEQGMRFAIREGSRTVGAGVVSRIIA